MSPASPISYATSADGARIAWRAEGEGPSLLFAPPWPVTMASGSPWPRIVTSTFGGRVIYFDRRGFGNSQANVEHSPERYADDLEAVADAAGLTEIVIYAAAAGCVESLLLAARTSRVTRILLAEPILSGSEWRLRPETRSILSLLDQDVTTFWRVMGQYAAGWGKNIGALAGTAPVATSNPGDIRALFDALGSCELAGVAPLVSAECLIIHNTGDSLVPHPHSAELARLLPNARLLLFTSPDRWAQDSAVADESRMFFGGENVPPPPRRDAEPLAPGCVAGLSARETQVLSLIAAGKSNREIADTLVISRSTVATHIHHILEKVGVSNRAAATAWAIRHGLAASRP